MGFFQRVRAQRRLRIKSEAELSYWRGRRDSEHGTLGRPLGAESLFCDRFGLDRDFYEGKRVLDIGCGPRGSLEWADMAAERIGIDPLVPEYRELGIEQHAMSYVTGAAERMPFEAGRFDVISTLNSLDHVDDLEAAVDELTRVAASGATWLVVVEADAAPTATEPQTIPWNLLDGLEGWRVETIQRFALDADHDIYGSWGRGVEWVEGPGLLVARLTRL